MKIQRYHVERFADFVLQGEGMAKVNGVYGYAVFYTAVAGGREMWGRDVLLLPERPGVREGVAIEMLTPAVATSTVSAPIEIGNAGALAASSDAGHPACACARPRG